MKIAIIGYGKMGKMIESIAIQRKHQISWIIDVNNWDDIHKISPQNTDIAIEFTTPDSAIKNLTTLISNKVSVVSGTTGWKDKLDSIYELAKQNKIGFLWTSNFSIGMNLFFKLNQYLAQLMKGQTDYSAAITEIHHIHKKDAPSGTAITLAEDIGKINPSLKGWTLAPSAESSKITITAIREGEVPGTHIIKYDSSVDTIEISHAAKGREGLAQGAIIAAEFLYGKVGIYTMNDVLSL
jgi:4-hydroxy-tetrahydrodipicolinate reductase